MGRTGLVCSAVGGDDARALNNQHGSGVVGADDGRALNIQHGTGVVREQGNQAYNEVVDIAHRWKNACEKLQEKQLVKNNNLHGDYHNALEKIQDLKILNEEICKELVL